VEATNAEQLPDMLGIQTMDMRSRAMLVIVCALMVAGCVTRLGPITPGTLCIIAESEIPVADRNSMLSRKHDEEWMLLTFYSDDEYQAIARRKDMHVFVNEALCADGRVIRDIMSSSLHVGSPPASLVGAGQTTGVGPKRYVYRTYLAMAAPKRAAAGADPGPAAGYDLRSETHDLCIQIQGGNMIGMSLKSGVATFSRTTVEAAIKAGHGAH